MKHSVTIKAFDAGLNTKTTPLQGQANESPDLQNVEFDDMGAVQTRMGYTNVGVNTASPKYDLLHSYRYNGGSDLVVVQESLKVWDGSTSWDAVTASVSGVTGIFTAGVRVHAENAQNYMFLSNGTQKYKYNGTDFTQWGVATPSTAAISSIVSGNSTLAGAATTEDYAYRISYINSTNVESEASAVKTFTVSSTCSPVTIGLDVPVASAGVNYLSLYRNDYLLTVVAAGTTSYSDTHATLTVARDQTILDSRPPSINVFLYHNGYMFGAEENSTNLYYSTINSPEQWDSDNYFRVGDGDGFTIRGLAIYNNGLIIAKEDGNGNGNVYVLYMPDSNPDNWSLELLDLSYGGVSPMAICRFATFLMMINKNGIYDLSQVAMGVLDSTPISYKIENDIKNFATTYLTRACAVAFKNKLWVSVPYGSNQSTNNRVYQYDYVRGESNVGVGAWTRFTNMAFDNICVHDGELFATGDYYVYKLNTTHNDDGVAIESYYKTMHIYGAEEHKENTKVWRYIYLTFDTSGAWNLELSWQGNYSLSDDGTYSLDLTPGGAVWGTAEWGLSVWGANTTQKTIKIPIHVVAKSIQVKFMTDGVGEYFKLYSMSLHYSLRGAR